MHISHTTTTNCLGPGKRYVIWVQGCKKRCKGCINPEGWKLDGGKEVSIEALISEIKSKKEIDGVTVSGGEPFLQFDELVDFVTKLKSETTLDIMIYSGYSLEELVVMYGNQLDKLFPYVDIFIDGEYIDELNLNSAYRGSDNQKIYCFTDKYKNKKAEIDNLKSRNFSFELKEGADVIFIGIPPKGFYKKFIEKIGDVNL